MKYAIGREVWVLVGGAVQHGTITEQPKTENEEYVIDYAGWEIGRYENEIYSTEADAKFELLREI